MGNKIGRNDPCWCGSGKKYKKCHLDRDKAPRMNPFVAEQKLKKHFSAKYCLHPEASRGLCRGSIARAHTIQRSGGLSRIAENGHVYSLKPSMKMLIELNGKVVPTSLGINQASTFTGFCGFHDSETFRGLEREPFVATDEQCFLLTYRAFSREFFMKRAMSNAVDVHRQSDTGLPLEAQMEIQTLVNLQELGVKKTIDEMEAHKSTLDTWLLSKDYRSLSHFVFYLDNVPNILCSGGFNPLYDISGARLQDIYDLSNPLDVMYFSMIPSEKGAAAVFSWIPKWGDACFKFMKELCSLPSSLVPDTIIRLSFEYLENVFFSPSWWDNLTTSQQALIQNRVTSGILSSRKADCLADDGVKYADSSIVDIATNVDGLA